MAKFVDKQNLVQYKYFNNLIGRKNIVDEIVSNYITGDHQLSNHLVQNNPREYRDSLLMLNKGKKELPAALYSMKEDQERCYNEIFYGSAKQTRQNANRYMDVLMFIRFFQGAQIKRNVEAAPEMLEGLSEKEKNKKYRFSREDGKFYSSFFSVPKLVLVNSDLFGQHLERDLTEEDMGNLEAMLPRDVHYILNVQCESQKDYAYLIAREENIYMRRLGRYALTPEIPIGIGETMEPELRSVALCLTDYLLEMKKLMGQQTGRSQEAGPGSGEGPDRRRVSKYVDQNSIKIFDIAAGAGKESYELEVSYFKKKYGGAGTARRTGYEMAPHTRRGHYRQYKDGKTVYVHSSVIHKEKYDGIQSAHRINETGENNTVQEDPGGPSFTMGM
ncbi:MAG: hypothetical protein NC306_08890 [Butyrivibrio sp.]|nr:hypothetical protein [Butyrivibrio sp.]